MKRFSLIAIGIILLFLVVWIGIFYWRNLRGIGPAINKPAEDISKIINTTGMPLQLPPGFSISVFAQNLESPRVMAWDPGGNLLVSIPSAGKVVALPDKNRDGLADEAVTVIENLNRPHGLAFKCAEKCKLYIAETDQVAIYDYDDKDLKAINKRKIIDLPGGGNHVTRTLMFLPPPNDDKLLISVGSGCNVCNESDWRRAKILVADADGGNLKGFAAGLRNSVFMALHPVSGKVWATDMGRDLLGDDLPPDEINIIEKGKNYGWPICYGKNVHDAEFDRNVYIRNPCTEPFEAASYIDIPAHSAPLGLAFIPEEGWSQQYWHNLLVAYHGSWNRSVPTGYKIVRYKFDNQEAYFGEEDFITGWLRPDGTAVGRPVDILVQPGGKIYISDDKAGVVYLVKYQAQE
ncbi:MAG: PQQ-dependent sugar dehydrogenase [Candidatus Harrisonbacteria bacterium]|nr:PQQ-dependent sugar dehydrogenase [Candidatus Harrisonbacteria bacterium]